MKQEVQTLLELAHEWNASDLHLSAGSPPVLRVDGELRNYETRKLTSQQTESLAKSIMTDKLWEIFQREGELDFAYHLDQRVRFRVNVYLEHQGISLALRRIPSTIPSLEILGLPAIIERIATKPQGLVLVTGPTGSGKTTTLAAMLDYINKTMSKHIVTLEDPIEYQHRHQKSLIHQREVGMDTQSFATGLRAALRQDPDIILVGEMRDLQTISTALTAAETGHLVMATLHTMDAISTIDRLIDVFPSEQQFQIRFQLASVLVAIISQRLFPAMNRQGRCAAAEIMLNNAAVANLIRSGKVHQITSLMQMNKALGMQTLEMAVRELVQREKVTNKVLEAYLQGRK